METIKISIRVNKDFHDTLTNASNKLNISINELCKEFIYDGLKFNSHKLSTRMLREYQQKNLTLQQYNLYFVKNCIVKIVKQCAWRYRSFGQIDHNIIISMVEQFEISFGLLDEETKILIGKEFKHVTELKNKKTFEIWVENTLPSEVNNIKNIAWRTNG